MKHGASSGKIAVIYCRVSSSKQTTRGDGLSSQETRCREFAGYRGHEVVKVFKDDASGGLIDRPGMKAMLAFIRSKRKASPVVVIDDISRLARGLEAHLQLRAAIGNAGGTLENPSIEFGEDSDSLLVENLLASVSQHQRQKNGEQTKNRMRARALNGYWVFQAPTGYRYERQRGCGNVLVRDEPLASIIAEALEGFASERFGTQVEVKRFLEDYPEFPRQRSGDIPNQRVTELLTQPLYAGHIEVPRWDVPMRKGQHEGLISFETFQTIQERLNGKARAPVRRNINEDFPLRGAICCADCDQPLTANWSKSRSGKRHAYYLCRTKGCVSEAKSIRRAEVEGAFESLLKKLVPSRDLFELAEMIFRDLWEQRLEARKAHRKSMAAEVSQIDRKVEQLLDRIVETESDSVVKAYENRIRDLESEKLILNEKVENCGREASDYASSFRTAMSFLGSPWNLWVSDRLEDKHAVIKLAFSEQLSWKRGEGLRTPEIALPFKALQGFSASKEELARPAGFEPAASGLEVPCSIQLS